MKEWKLLLYRTLSVVVIISMLLPSLTVSVAQPVSAAAPQSDTAPHQPYLPLRLQGAEDDTYWVYLPVMLREYNPAMAKIQILAGRGGLLQSPDGTSISVPSDTFSQNVTLSYVPLSTVPEAPDGMVATSRAFELQALAPDGSEIHDLAQPVMGRVPFNYDEMQSLSLEDLRVWAWDELSNQWETLPSSINFYHSKLIFTTTHFSKFALMTRPLENTNQCTQAEVGRGTEDVQIISAMCRAFLRADQMYGQGAMGVAQDNELGDVHFWDGLWWQDFTGSDSLLSPVIVYSPDTGMAYFMSRSYVSEYVDNDCASGILGLPRSDQLPKDHVPAWFVDDEHDFRDGPIMFYQYGFIGYNKVTGDIEAHRNFPQIKQVTWETLWQVAGQDDDGNPLYRFTVRGSVSKAEANPHGKPDDNPPLRAGFWVVIDDEDGTNDGILSLDIDETGEVTFSPMYTQSLPYHYYFFVWRDLPNDLSGYYPCNHASAEPNELGYLHGRMGNLSKQIWDVDCAASGGGGFVDLPPQLEILDVWQNGEGEMAITVRAVDDIGISSVTLESDSGMVSQAEMSSWPDAGPNAYASYIIHIPPNKKVHFIVTATDTAGQTATATDEDWAIFTSAFGACQAGKCLEGNPVNTATGNGVESLVDLVVPGRGGTDIVIQRNYNTQDPRNGPFGKGSSFEYDMHLEEVNNILLQGVQVRYGDGHTVNFKDVGGGKYESVSPGTFDVITKEGSDYVLRLRDRTTYRFDSHGRLREIRNRNDVPITLGYSGDHVTSITNASGRTVTLQWSGDHIVEVHAPEGKVLRYTYDGDLLTAFTDAEGNTTRYRYDGEGRLIEVTTPNGYPLKQQEFDSRGRIVWEQVGASERREFTYDDETRTTTVSDANGNVKTYVYDENYLIAKVIDRRGNVALYDYDDRGNLRRYTDRRGFTWTYDYDEQGNRIYQSEPTLGENTHIAYERDETRWAYNEYRQVISTTNALGYTTRYEYDEQGNLTHIYLPDGSSITMTYDSYGDLLTVTDGEGRTTTNTYDPTTGDLVAVTDGEGNTTRFGYDSLGRQTVITDANGYAVHIAYDGSDRIVSVTDARGQATRFVYDGNGNLTDLYDRADGHTHNEYDTSDHLILSVDPEGARTAYAYGPMGYTTVITNPRGYPVRYEYDAEYNVVAMIDEAGYRWEYEYDENGNLIKETDPQGYATRYVYDAVNRLKYEIDPLGNVTEYCYDPEDQIVNIFDPRRAETRFFYDPLGHLSKMLDALGATTTWTYDRSGNLIAETNGEGETTRYVYDGANRLIRTIDPLSRTITMTYAPAGNLIAVTDARGNTTSYGYDPNGNLTVITNALGYTVTFGYDPEDRRLWVRDPEGSLTWFDYYQDGLLKQITEPGGATTQFFYDPNGNLVERINALGRATHYTYDPRDLLLTETDPLSHTTRYTYDELQQLIAKTDAEGKTYRYDYDPLGRLIRVTDPISGVTAYTYDEVGNLTLITYTNGTTSTFYYNHLNQLVMEVDALNRTWRYSYDQAGRLVRKVDGEWRATYYEYDDAGQLTRVIFGSSGKEVTFGYDANGNPVEMRDWNGLWRKSFDELNRPITVTDYLSRSLVYAWNPDGSRAALTYPDGRTVTYTYDADNDLITFTLPGGQTAGYAYDALHQLTRMAYANGTQTDFSYDEAGRLLALHNSGPGGQVIAWYDYVLDKVGNRVQTTERRLFVPGDPVATIERHYTYDDLHRLIASTSSLSQTHEMHWELDSVGNWERRYGTPEFAPTEPLTTTYEHNPINALVQAGDWLFRYDGNGNRVGATAPITATQYAALTTTFGLSATLVITYEYDYENHLTDVQEGIRYPRTETSGTLVISTTWAYSPMMVARYVYDGLGRRMEKWVTRTITATALLTAPQTLHRQYLYDGLDAVVEYEARDGAPYGTAYYYRANGRIVAQSWEPVSGTAQLRWFHYDGLGSVVALTDESGDLLTAYRYDEYGLPFAGDIEANRYTYTGQEWDGETGFYHFFARYYDARNGVWVTEDENRGVAYYPLSTYRYMFVHNNPIGLVDPLGFETKVIVFQEDFGPFHIGSHTSLWVENSGNYVLYDPGGSYSPPGSYGFPGKCQRGSGDVFYGECASLQSFYQAKKDDKSHYTVYTINTTPEQEAQIVKAIEEHGSEGVPFCASSVSNVLKDIPPFANHLSHHLNPLRVGKDLSRMPGVTIETVEPGGMACDSSGTGDLGKAKKFRCHLEQSLNEVYQQRANVEKQMRGINGIANWIFGLRDDYQETLDSYDYLIKKYEELIKEQEEKINDLERK